MINKILNKFGYKISSIEIKDNIMDKEFKDIYDFCKKYTMTSKERMYALFKSIEYIIKNDIKGDFVECGVWKGGSAMLIMMTLLKFNVKDRLIYLYDTFEGMPQPSKNDERMGCIQSYSYNKWIDSKDKEGSNWNRYSINDVKKNIYKIGYPKENLILVKGLVEDTLKDKVPKKICLLRLDTDFYKSTKFELEKLYPLLTNKGVLIIDDYGYWSGCKQAVDEFIEENNLDIFLNRIDYSGRICIKYDRWGV